MGREVKWNGEFREGMVESAEADTGRAWSLVVGRRGETSVKVISVERQGKEGTIRAMDGCRSVIKSQYQWQRQVYGKKRGKSASECGGMGCCYC